MRKPGPCNGPEDQCEYPEEKAHLCYYEYINDQHGGTEIRYNHIISEPAVSTGSSSYLEWICVLALKGMSLDGDAMASKPRYPGYIEPPQRRLPVAPETKQSSWSIITRTSNEREVWSTFLAASIDRAYNLLKAKAPERQESDIVREMNDMWVALREELNKE